MEEKCIRRFVMLWKIAFSFIFLNQNHDVSHQPLNTILLIYLQMSNRSVILLTNRSHKQYHTNLSDIERENDAIITKPAKTSLFFPSFLSVE